MPTLMKSVVCMDCGQSMPFEPLPSKCSACGSVWLDVKYDYEEAAPVWKAGLHLRDTTIWRYWNCCRSHAPT